MKPLFVLVLVFAGSLLLHLWWPAFDYHWAGKLALSAMLLLTAFGHFRYPQGMMLMIPPPVPAKRFMVLASGIWEILAAIGILVRPIARPTAILLILFFVLILPANIWAAQHRINFEKADFTGHSISYLWFRIPLQILFIGWTYFFILKPF